jgi:hypothetical protein
MSVARTEDKSEFILRNVLNTLWGAVCGKTARTVLVRSFGGDAIDLLMERKRCVHDEKQ